jgi:hypothetical protein
MMAGKRCSEEAGRWNQPNTLENPSWQFLRLRLPELFEPGAMPDFCPQLNL